MNTQASEIIKRFGGIEAVAELLGVSIPRIRRWTSPEDKWGTSGRIPSKHYDTLLKAAKERGVPLAPEDFFEAAQ